MISLKAVGSRTSQHCFRWNYSYGKEPNMKTSCHAREVADFLTQGHLGAIKIKIFFFSFQWIRVRKAETSFWIRIDLKLWQSFLLLELATGTELVNFLFIFPWKYRQKLVSPAKDLKVAVKSRQIMKHCRFSDKRSNVKCQNDNYCWPMLSVLGEAQVRSEVGWITLWCLIPLAAEEALGKRGFIWDS